VVFALPAGDADAPVKDVKALRLFRTFGVKVRWRRPGMRLELLQNTDAEVLGCRPYKSY
jgi:hypothetical protein